MAKPTTKSKSNEEFYEAMPATWDQPFYEDDEYEAERQVDSNKRTAVITLALTALAAIVLAVLLVRGFSILQDSTMVPASQVMNER